MSESVDIDAAPEIRFDTTVWEPNRVLADRMIEGDFFEKSRDGRSADRLTGQVVATSSPCTASP